MAFASDLDGEVARNGPEIELQAAGAGVMKPAEPELLASMRNGSGLHKSTLNSLDDPNRAHFSGFR